MNFQWWYELIIPPHFPRVRFLDECIHTFSNSVSLQSSLRALEVWASAKVDNCSLQRSVWQDSGAIKICSNLGTDVLVVTPGREITHPGVLQAQLVDYISYDQTDFLQAPHRISMCCPANSSSGTYSAAPFAMSFM